MGNSIRTVGLLNTVGVGEDQPFYYQLGRKVSIHLSERRVTEILNKKSEEWTMSYTVDVSTCKLTLTKDDGGKDLLIKVHSVIPDITGEFYEYPFKLVVNESDARVQSIALVHLVGPGPSSTSDFGTQIHPGGNVTKTWFFLFGTGDVGSFIVLEEKRRRGKNKLMQ